MAGRGEIGAADSVTDAFRVLDEVRSGGMERTAAVVEFLTTDIGDVATQAVSTIAELL